MTATTTTSPNVLDYVQRKDSSVISSILPLQQANQLSTLTSLPATTGSVSLNVLNTKDTKPTFSSQALVNLTENNAERQPHVGVLNMTVTIEGL